MAEFFFFLAILFQCGLFPMGPSDCQPRARRAAGAPEAVVYPVERQEAP